MTTPSKGTNAEPPEIFIDAVLKAKYGAKIGAALPDAPIIKYLRFKTRSVDAGSKSRGSFGSLYAIYVLVEDYLKWKRANPRKSYSTYEGMRFSEAFARQRELPFGDKLQNHALNSRCNEEFKKYFPKLGEIPITRDLENNRYWINEKLLIIETPGGEVNVADAVIEIVDKYIVLKREKFTLFFEECEKHALQYGKKPEDAIAFVTAQLDANVDARIFEVVSFSILKSTYENQTAYVGNSREVKEVPLRLYRTGRTNANDGGIDFVLQPFGRFFQVTEVLDFKKYFLDIEKLLHYPITFVIKTPMEPDGVMKLIEETARREVAPEIVEKYLGCFEEVITLPTLGQYLREIVGSGELEKLLRELVLQCKVEFNLH